MRMDRQEMQSIKLEYTTLRQRCGLFLIFSLIFLSAEVILIAIDPQRQPELYNWTIENPIVYLMACVAFFALSAVCALWAYHYWILYSEYKPDLIMFCPNCNHKIDFTQETYGVTFCSMCGVNIWNNDDDCSDCINKTVLDKKRS